MVRTRFAPSPTGFLHIGGVRTALFNWLFARKHDGRFILRIDDTDQQRNQTEALRPILDGFRWLGLDWDEGAEVGGPHEPYYQSQRMGRYQQAVAELLAKGAAYRDYATTDEITAEREAAKEANRPFLYSRRWMAETPEQARRFEAEGRQGVVRLKMPRQGACTFHDHVRGQVTVEWAHEQDSVVQRADGTVLYNLASVVDDFDMGITHVIRAEEHLSNTPRQIFALEALGYPRPEYAHIPFVAEPGSKNKLSKRKIAQYLRNPEFKRIYDHGKAIADRLGIATNPDSFNPVLVAFYETVGYLPDAIVNYLMLLGWAHEDGKSEFFTRPEMIELFSLERVNQGAASFDPKKLFAFQEQYMKAIPADEKVRRCLPFLERAGLVPSPASDEVRATVAAVVAAAAERIRVFGDILDYDFLFVPDERIAAEPAVLGKYADKAFKKSDQKPPATDVLARLRQVVATADPFDSATLKKTVEDFGRSNNAGAGDLSQVLRVAVTGREVGFSAYDTLAILGKERCLARIDRVLAAQKQQTPAPTS